MAATDSSNYPIHHGIKLADNGRLANLHVEVFTTDPVPVVPGRIWFSETDKVFKQSTLNSSGAVVVRKFATVEELEAAVTDLQASIDAVASDLADEVTRATGAEAAIASDLADEVTRATAAEAAIASDLADEVTRATAAEAAIASDLADEVTRATAAEAAIASDLADEETRALAAEAAIASDLADEVTRATAAEAAIASDLADEVTRATAAESALDGRVTTIEGSYIKKDGSVSMTGDLNLDSHSVTNLSAPVNSGDAVNKAYVDNIVGALGSAFNYVGVLEGGATSGAAYDMSTLASTSKDVGDYFKVSVAGYFKVGAAGTPFFANVGDGLVWNTVGGVDKIDNTDSTVTGTSDYIAVTGSADTGFTVDIDSAFKTRMSNAETDISTLEVDLADEITRATAAESAIASDLADEVTRATAAESAIASDLADEVTRATAAESAIASDLADEVTRATAAESAIASDLADEVTRATAAEAAIASDLADEVTRATAAEAAIASDLADEVTRATAAEQDIRDDFNALRYTEQTSSAATTHTITHNLNSQFVDFTVMVERETGVWRNDIVSVEHTSNNVLTVYLSTAKKIRISVTSMASI